MSHKFAVGDSVRFHPVAPMIDMARGLSVVKMPLSDIDGEFAYPIKDPNELHERIAKESELSGGGGTSSPAVIAKEPSFWAATNRTNDSIVQCDGGMTSARNQDS
jgi:hypothetical protein